MDGADVKWTFEHEKLKATVGLWVLNDNNLAAQLKYINTLRAAIGNTIQVKFFGVPYTVRFFDDRCGTSFTAHIRRGELAEFLTSVENKQRIVSAVSYDPTAFDSPFSERLYNHWIAMKSRAFTGDGGAHCYFCGEQTSINPCSFVGVCKTCFFNRGPIPEGIVLEGARIVEAKRREKDLAGTYFW